jgi:hypothetical protein
MRVGQVFQQEVPRSCVGVPSGVKAAQELLVWSGRGHLIVKGNFLSTSVPIGNTQTVGTACLEHDRTRRVGRFTVVDRTKTRDFRQDCCLRALHDDIANASVAKRARVAKCLSEVLRACRRGQRLLCHGNAVSLRPERRFLLFKKVTREWWLVHLTPEEAARNTCAARPALDHLQKFVTSGAYCTESNVFIAPIVASEHCAPR